MVHINSSDHFTSLWNSFTCDNYSRHIHFDRQFRGVEIIEIISGGSEMYLVSDMQYRQQ